MVKEKTILNWNYSCLGYKVNEKNDVTKIFCKTCRKFFRTEKSSLNVKGRVQGQVDKFIEVKNNLIKAIFFYGLN